MQSIIGSVEPFAFNFVPDGWLSCNGQTVSIFQYTQLFSLIFTTYGGDGERTFGLPNLPQLGDLGPYWCICAQGVMPVQPQAAKPT
jgi:microcystin-dependent protein